MSDPGDELLAKEDWRYFAIDRAGTGLGSIATSEWLKKKQEIGFGLPSAPALFLNLAFEAYRKRVGTNVEKLFDEHPESQGTYPENHTPLFDYFETAMSEIIFSYSAIEAALNEIIPSDFIYERAGKAGRPPTRMSAQEIERTISLNEKIKQVLPKALGKISPASGKLWPPYSKLQDLRDRLIHLKSVDRKSSGPEEETIWGRLLKLGATSYPNVASDMINHFYPPNRRWFRIRPRA